jgi:hypothetical protein
MPSNIKGFGPVVNADVYNAMIAKSPWYLMEVPASERLVDAQDKSAQMLSLPRGENFSQWMDYPLVKTDKGYISPNDINVMTQYGVPSEKTDIFTQEALPQWEVTNRQLAAMQDASAGPVSDSEEYADIKKRADKTAKKKLTFDELVKKSKEVK